MAAPEEFATDALLDVEHLAVSFVGDGPPVKAVSDVSLTVRPGETVALVGESGSGKSVTCLSIMRLLAAGTARVAGAIRFGGRDLQGLSSAAIRSVRGREIAMVFQEPMTSLNPVFRVGEQVAEVIRTHEDVSRKDSQARAVELLRRVGIPNPERRSRSFPHELSGGMRQRVMIAIGLACRPSLLIADEPTTALDVTTQAQIIDLIRSLQQETGMAVLFVTHDLGVVAEIAERVYVMYAGRVVEEGTADDIFYSPRMPYTAGLLQSVPRLHGTASDGLLESARLATIPGEMPDPRMPPDGCAFHPRCSFSEDQCRVAVPGIESVNPEGAHRVRCRRWAELGLEGVGVVSSP